MEKELNIAAILKDKPAGTKLWSPIFGNCKFSRLSDSGIRVSPIHNGFTSTEEKPFFVTGQYTLAGEVCLFPSKQMQDWSKFAWKKGDVLVSNDSESHIIFNGFSKDDYTTFKGKYWICVSKKRYISHLDAQNTQDYHIEDDKAVAQTYINTVEERLGGKLNLETLEIEHTEPKQEFKDGDIVYAESNTKYPSEIFIYYAKNKAICYACLYLDELKTCNQKCYVYVGNMRFRYATEKEKQQLFDALAKKGKRWNPDTKSIEDLPKKCEFKPFQKVLAKFDEDCEWMPDFFYHYDKSDSEMPYVCIANGRAIECIPYNEETKHLLGTTDEWKGGEG